jgi:hypothetical protein
LSYGRTGLSCGRTGLSKREGVVTDLGVIAKLDTVLLEDNRTALPAGSLQRDFVRIQRCAGIVDNGLHVVVPRVRGGVRTGRCASRAGGCLAKLGGCLAKLGG